MALWVASALRTACRLVGGESYVTTERASRLGSVRPGPNQSCRLADGNVRPTRAVSSLCLLRMHSLGNCHGPAPVPLRRADEAAGFPKYNGCGTVCLRF